jgi:tartrate-resistant acid phosphatase type 5
MFLVAITVSALLCAFVSADMNFLIAGDWGGQGSSPYTTKDEIDTAKIMGEVAGTVKASMAWMLGDNFYSNGVVNENDKRFKETFEDVFTADTLMNIPFWVVAGNHDHHQNVSGEIEYSNHSVRWMFPDFYYTVTWPVPGTSYTLQVVMIDTVLLCGGTDDLEYCEENGILAKDCVIQPTGPDDPKVAATQWQWINDTLKASTADFLIVAGHYPVWSIAEHGPTKCLVEGLRPALIAYNVNYFMNGHDHTFELIIEEEYPDLLYITTGGAHTCDSSTAHSGSIPKNSLKFHGCSDGGFTRINIGAKGMYTEYYYGSGTKVEFTTHTVKPRTKVKQM